VKAPPPRPHDGARATGKELRIWANQLGKTEDGGGAAGWRPSRAHLRHLFPGLSPADCTVYYTSAAKDTFPPENSTPFKGTVSSI
jgi:hypothetical protein